MLIAAQFASYEYLAALLPSTYSVRRHFPRGTQLRLTVLLGAKQVIAPEVQRFFDALSVTVAIIRSREATFSRDMALSACNRQFLSVLRTSGESDVFYLDADCYFRRAPTWEWVQGDIVFGSHESRHERAPRAFPGFCTRLGIGYLWNHEYYGSCVYVKSHAKPSYAASLERLLDRNAPYQYFDDMHYRLAAAYLSGLRIAVAPKELEYKVVFPNSRSDDPEMLHLCFSLDWYRKDPSYPWFLQVIRDFLSEHPELASHLDPVWVSDARCSAPTDACGLERRGLNSPASSR